MTDVVFATVDAGGNVPPLKYIAVEVARRGHRVRVLGHEQQRAEFERAGLEFHAYTESEPPWDPTVQRPTLQAIRAFVSQFTGQGADLQALLQPGSVAVVDCMQLSGLKAAQEAGVPTAALVHSFHAYFDGGWRRGPIGILARLKGLGARKLWRNCQTVLISTDRSLDPAGSRTWPDSFVWTGPIQPKAAPSSPVVPPRVLVSLSTIAFPGQQETLQNILDGLAGEPIETVVTTGPAVDPTTLTVPANAEVHAFLPHEDVLPACSAVIGHGGHATTVRALAHGLPLVIMPMHPMLDQAMVGKAVEKAGAGVSIKRTASPEEIRAALETVLNGQHRAAAEALAARWRDVNGAAVAADHILAMSTASVSP
jgi:UDP:flavonoid glycosyltransferase YjiC (YdhE family)